MVDLEKTATAMAKAFVPAELAQKEAALHAARSLAFALELSEHPDFANEAAAAGAVELAHVASLAVQASFALSAAHRRFGKALPSTSLPEKGWGCEGNRCLSAQKVVPFEPAKAA